MADALKKISAIAHQGKAEMACKIFHLEWHVEGFHNFSIGKNPRVIAENAVTKLSAPAQRLRGCSISDELLNSIRVKKHAFSGCLV
jgi:hypothetical protein